MDSCFFFFRRKWIKVIRLGIDEQLFCGGRKFTSSEICFWSLWCNTFKEGVPLGLWWCLVQDPFDETVTGQPIFLKLNEWEWFYCPVTRGWQVRLTLSPSNGMQLKVAAMNIFDKFLCWSVLHAHSLQQGVTCASFKALTPATVRRLTPLVCLLISFSLPEADLMKQPFLAGLSYWCPGRSNFDLRRWWNDFPWSLDVRLDHQLMIVEKGCQLKADLMDWPGLPEKAVACFTHIDEWVLEVKSCASWRSYSRRILAALVEHLDEAE